MKKTKDKILLSAIEVFSTNINASLEDVAKHANMSRRTLHRHYAGREDLMKSLGNFLLDEYLLSIRTILRGRVELTHQLNALLINDIEWSKRYLLFAELQKDKATGLAEENVKIKELHATYFLLFEQLKQQNLISEFISVEWLKVFYVTLVEAAIRGIQDGLELESCLKMAWISLWSGIKPN